MANEESWRKVWREGVGPLLSTKGLEALKVALATDDPRLLQGATTSPAPHVCASNWPVEAACLIGYAGWQSEDMEHVGQVEEYFGRICFEIGQRMSDCAACRFLLNWFDETPRDEMRSALLPEVERSLRLREEELSDNVSKNCV